MHVLGQICFTKFFLYLMFSLLCHAPLCTALWDEGYAAIDIITTLFRVCKNADIADRKKLVFIKEIGFTHMRISDGVDSLLQINGLLSRYVA